MGSSMLGCLILDSISGGCRDTGAGGNQGVPNAAATASGKGESGLKPPQGRKSIWLGTGLAAEVLLLVLAGGVLPASAQQNTRLLLTSGTEVPGHGGGDAEF